MNASTHIVAANARLRSGIHGELSCAWQVSLPTIIGTPPLSRAHNHTISALATSPCGNCFACAEPNAPVCSLVDR